MPLTRNVPRRVNALGGKRPQATGIALIPKNGDRKLATSKGSTSNFGGNKKYGMFPNVGMNYLFQNKYLTSSMFYTTTTPSQATPPPASYIDGPGILVDLPLAASAYVGPEGTFTFTAGSTKPKVNGLVYGADHRGFAYIWSAWEPEIDYPKPPFQVSQSNFPVGSVSGNRKILNGQAEIERIITDDDGGNGNDDIFISIYSDQLNETQLRNALSNLKVSITDLDGTVKTFDSTSDPDAWNTANALYVDLGGGKGVLGFEDYDSAPQINFQEGKTYSVVVTT